MSPIMTIFENRGETLREETSCVKTNRHLTGVGERKMPRKGCDKTKRKP